MASKFFKSKLNIGKKLQGMAQGESFVLELADNASFFDVQKNTQSYATRYKIKLLTSSLRAVNENDQVVRLLKIEHNGTK